MALEVETLEESFDLVASQGDELVSRFYERLFETAPAVKPLFERVDMDGQRQALLNMLVVLRESLRDLDDIVPDLEDLGDTSSTAQRPRTTRSSAKSSSAPWPKSPVTGGSRNTRRRGRRRTASSSR